MLALLIILGFLPMYAIMLVLMEIVMTMTITHLMVFVVGMIAVNI